MTKVLFVCLGNICRSPMAEAVFRSQVRQAGLEDIVEIDSAGTAAYHVGKKPDPRTLSTLQKYDIETPHCGRQVKAADFDYYDWIIAMDHSNLNNLKRINLGNGKAKLVLMRDFEPEPSHIGKEVPDPYYGEMDGFEEVYNMLERCCESLLKQLALNR